MNERLTALEVGVEALTARCDPASLPFDSTDELHALDAVFGQERAVRAIEFALGIQSHGYNLYASGPDGIGKSSIIDALLRSRAEDLPAPQDWVYVHNFEDPDRPVGIALPADEGRRFAEAVRRTVERAAAELRQVFDADSYVRQRAEVGGGSEQRRGDILQALQQRAEEMGFALQMTPQGIMSAPLIDGQPATDEVFAALPQEQQERIQARAREELEPVVQDSLLEMRGLEREAREELERLDERVAEFATQHLFAQLRERYEEQPRVLAFLEAVRADIVKERDRLRLTEQGPQMPAMGGPSPEALQQALMRRYEVNALICNDAGAGAPVITETNPTYVNLLGRIEYVGQFGTAVTDHTMIRPGTLGLASGGYLMLRMRDLLQNAASYDGLKRALHSGELAIESLQQALGLIPTAGLRPEPMPLDVKVVIVGDAQLYSYLYRLDPDFRELFRVKADFEVDFERTPENIVGLASVIHSQCDRAGMHCFSDAAVARLIEHSSRQVEDQRRLSGNIGALLDSGAAGRLLGGARRLRGGPAQARRAGARGARVPLLAGARPAAAADRRGHDLHRHRGREGRADQRAVGLRPGRHHVRAAVADHVRGLGGARDDREHRARDGHGGPHAQQGVPDPARVPRRPLRAGHGDGAAREPDLRAALRGHRRGLGVLDRAVRAALGADGGANPAVDRGHRLAQPARRGAGDRRRDREDRGLLRGLQGRVASTARRA